MSGKNDDILNFLKELTQRRLLGDELEKSLSPFKGTVLSLNLIFQSVSKCFGPQEDEIYNEGYSLNSRTDDSELELTVLFIKEDEEFVNSLQQGQEFEVNVKFIGYDQLYSKPIFGKIDDEPQIFEDGKDDISNNQNSSQSLEENIVVSKHTSPDESGLTKTKQESYSYKSAEPYDYGIDDTNKKFEDNSFEEPDTTEMASGLGCLFIFISIFLIIGGGLAHFDGMNSSFFIKFGFLLLGLGLVISAASGIVRKLFGKN